MINEIIIMVTLISIWLSILLSLVTISGATHALMHGITPSEITELSDHPTISIVVPAHNEEIVIQKTLQAIFNLNYPLDKIELLLFADNCTDNTYQIMKDTVSGFENQMLNIKVIDRSGEGGKAGVLNDALEMAQGQYIAVYDADAMPERNALYFLVKRLNEDPERYMAVIGRNKTRNAKQNFLTKCINQEIVVTHRIQHVGVWHLFKIARIPGTNFIINTEFTKSIGGWSNGALTEDTDISFKILQKGKLIALAPRSEAFQQEPEDIKTYYYQRLRWAKGNYQVVLDNFKHLFDRSNWRVKLETIYATNTYFWFNSAIILSDAVFLINLVYWIISLWNPNVTMPFVFTDANMQISQLLLVNWVLMITIYMLQIGIALSSQFGQETHGQVWLSLISYFTYSQLFIIVSIHAVGSVTLDKLFHRNGNKWVKTKRFED